MKIQLEHQELVECVEQKVRSLGFTGGHLKVSFIRRNQGMVDATIEILSEPPKSKITEVLDTTESSAKQVVDTLAEDDFAD